MMGKVIGHGHAVEGAEDLKAAVHAGKLVEAFCDGLCVHPHVVRDGNRSERVVDVVFPRNA